MAGEHFDAGARLGLRCAVGLRRTVARNDIGRAVRYAVSAFCKNPFQLFG